MNKQKQERKRTYWYQGEEKKATQIMEQQTMQLQLLSNQLRNLR